MKSPQAIVAAAVATALPFVFSLVALLTVTAVSRVDDFQYVFETMGAYGYVLVITVALATIGTAVMLLVTGLTDRFPWGLSLAVATVPAWVAAPAVSMQSDRFVEAVVHVNPADKGLIILAGLAEAVSARVVGMWSAAALLMAVALGLLLIALGRGRAGMFAVGAGALLAAVFSAVAGLTALQTGDLTAVYSAMIQGDPASRGELLSAGIEDFLATQGQRGIAFGVAGAAVLGALAYTMLRRRAPQDVVLITGSVLVAAAAFLFDRSMMTRAFDAPTRVITHWTQERADLELPEVAAARGEDPVNPLLVTAEDLAGPPDHLGAAFAEQLEQAGQRRQLRAWAEGGVAQLILSAEKDRVQLLEVVAPASMNAPAIRNLLRAAAEVDAGLLRFAVREKTSLPAPARAPQELRPALLWATAPRGVELGVVRAKVEPRLLEGAVQARSLDALAAKPDETVVLTLPDDVTLQSLLDAVARRGGLTLVKPAADANVAQPTP